MYVVVDVEADGPVPGLFSMVSLGAIIVDRKLDKTFFGQCRPISEDWIPDALKVSGYTREQTLAFPEPEKTMREFADWLDSNRREKERLFFLSDNNGFDWQFICWYFWKFYGSCPFGHSSTNIGSFYKGLTRDIKKSFKRLRKTKHDHNPVNDAKGNAEAFIAMVDEFKVGRIQI